MMKHFAMTLFCSVALLACTEEQATHETAEKAPPAAKAPATDFDSRMQQISQDYFRLRPETATYFGIPDEKAGAGTMSRLGSYSPEGETRRRAGLKAILGELAAIDKATLTDPQKISLQLVEIEAANAYAPSEVVDYGTVLSEYGTWFVPYPVSHLTGPHVEIPALLEDKMAVSNKEEAIAYLSRLNHYATALDDVRVKMMYDQELGVVPPDFSMDRAIANLTASVSAPATENTLVTSFSQKLADAGIERADEFIEQAATLVEEEIYPATLRLLEALNEIRPQASHDAGVGQLPNGAAFYRAMITHMTDTTLQADEIHAIGLVKWTVFMQRWTRC
jgi:uncharacterized protein (DUF885 family)